MLFCVASGTDWLRAEIRGAVARTTLVLTARGRAVLACCCRMAESKFAPLH
jgi:hypothetical protein